WWQLRITVPLRARMLVGLMAGTVGGIEAGFAIALLGGLRFTSIAFGATCGLAIGIVLTFNVAPMPSRSRLRVLGSRKQILTWLALAATAGLGFGLFLGPGFGLALAFVVMLAFGPNVDLETPIDLNTAVSPTGLIAADRKNAIVQSIGSGLMVGLVIGL